MLNVEKVTKNAKACESVKKYEIVCESTLIRQITITNIFSGLGQLFGVQFEFVCV